jgi:hypothetical protein
LLIEGHVALMVCLFYLGHVAAANTHLENGLAIDDPEHPQTYIFPSGQDLRVLGLAYDAMALWVLGYQGQALQRSRRAIHLAEGAAQPWTVAMALRYAALVNVLHGDRQAALERAEATIQLATAQGIFPWVGRDVMLQRWALAEQGREVEGVAHTRGLRVWEAELNRLQGELLLRQAVAGRHRPPPADPPASTGRDVWVRDPSRLCIEAEACFRQALENAHEQHAKSLELRATMSLSRLWQQLGNTSVARERLKESYHWFTESFDTADLRKAMALREALE